MRGCNDRNSPQERVLGGGHGVREAKGVKGKGVRVLKGKTFGFPFRFPVQIFP
jgi:hypothetical protein